MFLYFEYTWPNIDDLCSGSGKVPKILSTFYGSIIEPKESKRNENTQRLITSFSADMIHAVTHGKVLTDKHFLLGLGIHNITGQKKTVLILKRLGHCVNYNKVCEIETAQAEVAQAVALNECTLLIRPSNSEDVVLTHFWADNFDMDVETPHGKGTIHSTHMIAFQEKSESSVLYSKAVNIPRSGKRSIDYLSPKDDNTLYVNQKPEPPLSFTDSQQSSSLDITNALQRYIQWIIFRFLNSNDQFVPQHASCETKLRNLHANEPIRKTVMTYLPPLTTKITEYSTIKKYLDYMKKLTNEVNMPYVSLTLDVGAAMNTWKLIWNYPELYSNVLIHLGDFYYLKENFGKLVLNSGFEDIIFQFGICSQESLNGVIFGSHYNRGWIVHNAFSEALERLLLEHFLPEKEM